MNKILTLRLPTLLIVLMMSSCLSVKYPEFKEIKNVKLQKIGFSGVTMKGDVVFLNPNNFAFEINQTELEIFINNASFGKSSQQLDVSIPKKSLFTIPLVVDVDGKSLLKTGFNALFNNDVEISIKGNVGVRKSGFSKNIPVDFKTTQKISLF